MRENRCSSRSVSDVSPKTNPRDNRVADDGREETNDSLSFYLFVCLCVSQSLSLYIELSIYLSIKLSFYLWLIFFASNPFKIVCVTRVDMEKSFLWHKIPRPDLHTRELNGRGFAPEKMLCQIGLCFSRLFMITIKRAWSNFTFFSHKHYSLRKIMLENKII